MKDCVYLSLALTDSVSILCVCSQTSESLQAPRHRQVRTVLPASVYRTSRFQVLSQVEVICAQLFVRSIVGS